MTIGSNLLDAGSNLGSSWIEQQMSIQHRFFVEPIGISFFNDNKSKQKGYL